MSTSPWPTLSCRSAASLMCFSASSWRPAAKLAQLRSRCARSALRLNRRTAGSGFSPTGTLTADSDSLAQYFEYQIQTAATAANCPFTSVSAKYTDSQFALLNTASPAGYRSLTGFYGVPAIAKTNGASVTAADLNGATTTLSTLNANQGWSEIYAGAKATYSTAVSPTGTGGVLVNGAAHTFGNAGTSIEFTNTGSAATGFEWTDNQLDQGEPMWFSYFSRTASSGISSGQECDDIEVGPTVTVDGLTVQLWYIRLTICM